MYNATSRLGIKCCISWQQSNISSFQRKWNFGKLLFHCLNVRHETSPVGEAFLQNVRKLTGDKSDYWMPPRKDSHGVHQDVMRALYFSENNRNCPRNNSRKKGLPSVVQNVLDVRQRPHMTPKCTGLQLVYDALPHPCNRYCTSWQQSNISSFQRKWNFGKLLFHCLNVRYETCLLYTSPSPRA